MLDTLMHSFAAHIIAARQEEWGRIKDRFRERIGEVELALARVAFEFTIINRLLHEQDTTVDA